MLRLHGACLFLNCGSSHVCFLLPLVVAGRALELDDGDKQHQHKQHHGHGTCVAVLRRVDEGYVVDVVNKGHGRIAGAALGDHVHLVIHLEGGDGQHDDNEEGGGLQLRQGYIPEDLPLAGTVQLGSLLQFGVGALQTGQVDDHVIAHVLPDAEQDDREHSGVLTGGPLGQVLHAKGCEDLVDRAHGGAEDHVPDRSNGDQRSNVGEERNGTEEVAELDLLVQQHGQTKAARQRQRHRADGVDQRIDKSSLESFVAQQGNKVADAGELNGMDTIPVAERKPDSEDHGHQRKDAEADEVRCNEAVGYQTVAERFAHAALRFCLHSLRGFSHGSYLLGVLAISKGQARPPAPFGRKRKTYEKEVRESFGNQPRIAWTCSFMLAMPSSTVSLSVMMASCSVFRMVSISEALSDRGISR